MVKATSIDTGKVINNKVMSKYCRCLNKYKNEHIKSCSAKYSGVSVGMELQGVESIFPRSESQYNVRYTQYLGDGDSKAYSNVSELKVYGENCAITKLECIGHVQKYMGTGLWRLKTKSSGTKLADGKSLSGKGRLKRSAINYLTTYYGLAIRRNSNTNSIAEEMRTSIWALYFHILSSDDHPSHSWLCCITQQYVLYNIQINVVFFIWVFKPK